MRTASLPHPPPSDPPVGFANLTGFVLALVPAASLLFTDHLGTVSGENAATFLTIAAFLLVYPDRLSARFTAYWWSAPTVWTLLLLVGVALIGPLLRALFPWLPAFVFGGLVVFRVLADRSGLVFRYRSWPALALLLVTGFLYLSLYGRGYHHWFFTEAAARGEGILDTYFHAAVSESILQLGVPSTSIDGSPYLPYHWLSHALYGRLAATIGVNSFAFYHLFYPALFVPLGVKFLYAFGHRFLPTEITATICYPLLFTVGLFTFYALPLAPLTGLQPFVGESQLLALLLAIGHAVFLVDFAERAQRRSSDWRLCLVGTFLFALTLSFTKISTGFVWLGALAPVFLLHVPPRKWWWSVPPFVLLPVLIYLFALVTSRTGADVAMVERMRNLLGGGGRLLFLAWAPLLLAVTGAPLRWPARWSRSTVRAAVNRFTAPALVLLGVSVLGGIGALAASVRPADATYFLLPAVLLSFPLWLRSIGRLALPWGGRTRKLAGAVLVAATVLTTPNFVGGPVLARQDLTGLTNNATAALRLQFMRELSRLRTDDAGENSFVAVPEGEDWFWSSGPDALASSFLVPAVSGRPMIAGIPRALIEEGYRIYSVSSYPAPRFPRRNPSELLVELRGGNAGANLIVFRARGGKIVRKVITGY